MSKTTTQRPTLAIAAGLSAQTAGSVPISLIGALAPELQAELDFGDAQLGLIAAAYFFVGALFAPIGGRLVDRTGPALALRAVGVLAGISLLLEGLASSYPMLLGASLLGALSLAIATPASNVALVRHVPDHRRGLAFGLKQSAVPLAAMLSGLALPIVALTIGWRWAFAVLAVFPIASFLLAPPTPAAVQDGKATVEGGRRPRPPRNLILLAGVGLFGAGSVSSLNAFLVRAATEAGMSSSSAGLLLSVASAALIVSRVLWGAMLDRSGIDPVKLVFILITVGIGGFALLATGEVFWLAIGAVIAYAFGWAWPGVQFVAGVRMWPANPGEASGVLQLAAFSGATVSPLVFGVLAERYGFGAGYLMATGLAICAALLAGALTLRISRADASEA